MCSNNHVQWHTTFFLLRNSLLFCFASMSMNSTNKQSDTSRRQCFIFCLLSTVFLLLVLVLTYCPIILTLLILTQVQQTRERHTMDLLFVFFSYSHRYGKRHIYGHLVEWGSRELPDGATSRRGGATSSGGGVEHVLAELASVQGALGVWDGEAALELQKTKQRISLEGSERPQVDCMRKSSSIYSISNYYCNIKLPF
jgi:hypothetical protein